MKQGEVVNAGDPNCKHTYVEYLESDFKGQVWRCDGCPRKETISEKHEPKIRFPGNSYIRTNNEEYSIRANPYGELRDLPKDKRISIERKLA